MRKIVCGIDPGLNGSFAFLQKKDGKIKLLQVLIMPTIKVKKSSGKIKKELDFPAIVNLFKKYKEDEIYFCIQQVSAMSSQGVTSVFTFGTVFGALLAFAAVFGKECIKVTPQSWKKSFDSLGQDIQTFKHRQMADDLKEQVFDLERKLSTSSKEDKNDIKNKIKELTKTMQSEKRKIKTAAKDAARLYAQNNFPQFKDEFKKKSDDGKAESVMIGVHLLNKMMNN